MLDGLAYKMLNGRQNVLTIAPQYILKLGFCCVKWKQISGHVRVTYECSLSFQKQEGIIRHIQQYCLNFNRFVLNALEITEHVAGVNVNQFLLNGNGLGYSAENSRHKQSHGTNQE